MTEALRQSLMNVVVDNRQKKYPVNREEFLCWAQGLLQLQKLPNGTLGIVFVNDRQIRRYNREFRKQDRSTDVLSFSMRESSEDCESSEDRETCGDREGERTDLHPEFLGDVMISIETARREALLWGRTEREHLLALLIHGTLHLMGYDHERSEKEAERMKRRERILLRRLFRS